MIIQFKKRVYNWHAIITCVMQSSAVLGNTITQLCHLEFSILSMYHPVPYLHISHPSLIIHRNLLPLSSGWQAHLSWLWRQWGPLTHQYTYTWPCNITVQKVVFFSHHNEHLKHNTIHKWRDNNNELKNWKILHIEVPKCKY